MLVEHDGTKQVHGSHEDSEVSHTDMTTVNATNDSVIMERWSPQ